MPIVDSNYSRPLVEGLVQPVQLVLDDFVHVVELVGLVGLVDLVDLVDLVALVDLHVEAAQGPTKVKYLLL